jgi:HlyD family secretion protein
MTATRPLTNGPDAPARSLSLGDRVQSLRLPAKAPPRAETGRLGWVPWTLCGVFLTSTVVLGALFVTGLSAKPVDTLPELPAASPGAEARGGADGAPGSISLESKGYIIPAHQILVSPKVSGMIQRLHFDKLREGQRVPEGAPLAEIESVEYRAEAERAKASLAMIMERWRELKTGSRPEEITEAWNSWKEAERQFEYLKSTHDRNQQLRGRGVVSPEQLDQSESDFEMAEKRVRRYEATWKMIKDGPRAERIAAAAAEVALARAECEKAEWKLSNCIIRSPINGTILKKNAEEGNIVNPVAFNGSFSLCDIADLSDLEVDLSIQERDVSRVFALQKCKVRAEAYPDRVYDGYVSRLMPIADRAKGAVPVRVKIRIPGDEEGVYLKPEMGAIVTFFNEKVELPAAPESQPADHPATAETP